MLNMFPKSGMMPTLMVRGCFELELQLHRAVHQTLLTRVLKLPWRGDGIKSLQKSCSYFCLAARSPSAKNSPSNIPHLQCSKPVGYSRQRHHGETKPKPIFRVVGAQSKKWPLPGPKILQCKEESERWREKRDGFTPTATPGLSQRQMSGSYSPGCGLD